MNRFKILSILCTVMIFVCFFGFGFAGYMMVSSQGSLAWVIICFIGFPLFAVLSNIFKKISENQNPLEGSSQGSSEGIDSLSKSVIKVRCPHCGELNDEDAEFCKKCGGKMK
jgi:hypothetical protein